MGQRVSYGGTGQRGMTLVECLVATTVAVALAGGFCHAWLTYQSEYRTQMARVARGEQARFALAFLVDELRLAVWGDQGQHCPASGVQLVDAGVSFAANVYDRTTRLAQPALVGQNGLTLSAQVFEPNDLVQIVDVGDPTDPSDDIAECGTVTAVAGSRVTIDRSLTRAYPVDNRVLALSAVSYVLDERRGRLMRSQDGANQRVADGVESLALAWNDRTLTIGIGMQPPSATSQSIRAERWIVFQDIP